MSDGEPQLLTVGSPPILATRSDLRHETFNSMNVLEAWLFSAGMVICDRDGSIT
jgi:hypothetical protein